MPLSQFLDKGCRFYLVGFLSLGACSKRVTTAFWHCELLIQTDLTVPQLAVVLFLRLVFHKEGLRVEVRVVVAVFGLLRSNFAQLTSFGAGNGPGVVSWDALRFVLAK